MYHSPLTQTITTNLYTKSHIDLLCEEASPFSSPAATSPHGNDAEAVLDLTLAYSGDETRDGGATPGPFEEMRRRMAGLGTNSANTSTTTTPVSPGSALSGHISGGIRKRKQPRKDKKRRWVWTLGHDEEEEATLSGAMAALKAAQKAEEAAAATKKAEAEAAAKAEAEVDLKTPMATQPTGTHPLAAHPHVTHPLATHPLVTKSNQSAKAAEMPVASLEATQEQDVEMQDTATTTADKEGGSTRPENARKRKSTPIPYATDGESDFGGDDDIDMQTPTTALGNDLQGTWLLQAAAATTARAGEQR